MDIKLLFEYNWYCRRKFVEYWKTLPWDKVVEDFGASFGSMHNIFVHCLDAEQGWMSQVNYVTHGKHNPNYRQIYPHDYDVEFTDVEALEKHMREVEIESREYLTKFTQKDLDKIFDASWEVPIRVEDALMHLVEEEIHHRGELLCIMWQNDLEPPLKNWIDWLQETHVKTTS